MVESKISGRITINEEQIYVALRDVVDPDRGADIVSLGMVTGLVIKDNNVGFSLEVDPRRGPSLEPLRQAAEKAAQDVPGVLSVTAVLTAHTPAGRATAEQQSSAKTSPGAGATTNRAGAPRTTMQAATQANANQLLLPDVRFIVAVASGKGGVGKSTTAVNLALAFAAAGHHVGLLDADIYGPSMPRMLGISGRPHSDDGKILRPMENYGLRCMSMGFLVAEEAPMIWRGPMVMSAIQQMLRDVSWGKLDVLIVDMPPGTGDAQLTLSQQVPLAGAVIVSTPQDIALLDARKGLNMFRKVDVPVLGVIENMSYFTCPNCGHESHIFSHGGAKIEAEQLGVEFLGEIPLDIEIRETSDGGRPIVISNPDSPHAVSYRTIAARLWEKLDRGQSRTAPRIVIN